MATIVVYPTPQENEQFVMDMAEQKVIIKQKISNQTHALVEYINHFIYKLHNRIPETTKQLFKIIKVSDRIKKISHLRYVVDYAKDEPYAVLHYYDKFDFEYEVELNLTQLSVLYECYYDEFNELLKIC